MVTYNDWYIILVLTGILQKPVTKPWFGGIHVVLIYLTAVLPIIFSKLSLKKLKYLITHFDLLRINLL